MAEDAPLLDVRDLHVAFRTPTGGVEAVRGASFVLDKGETLAVVGESGSGKSVTALSIMQLLPYPLASHPRGSIRFRGTELVGASERTMRAIRGNRISMIFQEPLTALNPLHRIEKQIGEILQIHKGLLPQAARRRTVELLEMVGIRDAAQRLTAFPHELSGGQRQRVMIAMALANEPDILIADEPTTAVDVTIQAQILNLLKELQERMAMAIILITHDLTVARRMADRVAVMQGGEIVEQGPSDQVFSRPQHPYTRHLLSAEPKGRPEPADPSAPEILSTKDFRVWFPIKAGVFRHTVGHIKAVDGVTVAIREGQTVGVVGESGSGKTTLAMGLLRLIASDGPVVYQGRDIQGWRSRMLRPLRREMQIVFQDPFGSLSPRLSVGEIVAEGLNIHRIGRAAEREGMIVTALEEVGLDPESRHRYPHEFSGGQRQRIAVARAMVLKPRFVVLDEPTSALDMSVQAQIVELLRKLQRDHRLAYLFISHDLRVIRAMSHHIVVMHNGKVVEQGPAERVLDAPQHPYTRALMAAAFELRANETGEVAT
ncbi:MAG TPA: ABC transporter ATP-binding protein [Alphaproteobacteria bacterium]